MLRIRPRFPRQIALISTFLLAFVLSFIYGTRTIHAPVPETSAAALKGSSSPSLSSSLSPSTLTIASYTANSTIGTGTITATTTTDNPKGYIMVLTTKDTNTCLRHTSVAAIACNNSASSGKRLDAGNLVGDNQWSWSNNGGTTWTVPQNNTGTTKLFELTNGPYTNDARTITMGVKATPMMPNGAYQNTLVLTTTPGYIAAPTITSVYNTGTTTNATGPTTGGTVIDVIGTNLDTAYQVFIDLNGNGTQDSGEQCTSSNIISVTKITCTAPAHSTAQARNVRVNTWGGSAVRTNGFTYAVPPPTITSVSPSSGHFRGGETVTIIGTNFTGAYRVRIGEDTLAGNCRSFKVVSDTQITCITPGVSIVALGGANNTMSTVTTIADVYVTTSKGVNPAGNNLFTYRYLNKSTTTAGSYMDILGDEIVLGSKIYVDETECTNRKVTSNTTAACNTPILSAGAKAVTIQEPTPEGIMQDWSGCSAIPTPNYATDMWWKNSQYTKVLTDARNGQNYRVRKMPDGRCWMIDNLKLANYSLSSVDSDVASGTTFTIPEHPIQGSDTHSNGVCDGGISSSTGAYLTCDGTHVASDTNSSFVAYSDPSGVDNEMYGNCVHQKGISPDSLSGCGYLYNWFTATAGTGTYGLSTGNAPSSLCPAGWKLPATSGGNQFGILNNAMATGATSSTTANNAITRPSWRYNGPFEGALSGAYVSGFSRTGDQAVLWAASAWNNEFGYMLQFSNDSLSPGGNGQYKRSGAAIRCLQ